MSFENEKIIKLCKREKSSLKHRRFWNISSIIHQQTVLVGKKYWTCSWVRAKWEYWYWPKNHQDNILQISSYVCIIVEQKSTKDRMFAVFEWGVIKPSTVFLRYSGSIVTFYELWLFSATDLVIFFHFCNHWIGIQLILVTAAFQYVLDKPSHRQTLSYPYWMAFHKVQKTGSESGTQHY